MHITHWSNSGKDKDNTFINGKIYAEHIWTKLMKNLNYLSEIDQIKLAPKHISSTLKCNTFHHYNCDRSPNEGHCKLIK